MSFFHRKKDPNPTPNSGGQTSSSLGVSSQDASTSSTSLTKLNVLKAASSSLEALKTISEASEVLAPLQGVCTALKMVLDTAVNIMQNDADLEELVEKLRRQHESLEQQATLLAKSQSDGSDPDTSGHIHALKAYAADLQAVVEKLVSLQQGKDGKKRSIFKKAIHVSSTREEIDGVARKLDESFQQFMNSITVYIAHQTTMIREDLAKLRERLDDQNAKNILTRLPYASARGNKHECCLQGTRVDLLADIAQWAQDGSSPPIFALVDQAGTGKSTVSTSMARKWDNDGRLLARFFFSKPTTVTGKDVATTLARDIADAEPKLKLLVAQMLENHPNFAACSLAEQLEWFLFTPLKALDSGHIIVIDALDECAREDRKILLSALLDFILNHHHQPYCPKILLTCRPESDITSLLNQFPGKLIHQATFSTYTSTTDKDDSDVAIYARQYLSSDFDEKQITRFVDRANGLFIWASTAIRFIKDDYDPVTIFDQLMAKGGGAEPLELLYSDILNAAVERAGARGKKILKSVLQAICVAYQPLSTFSIKEFLGLNKGVAERVVTSLRSVLSDGSNNEPVQILHPTFIEYLLSDGETNPLPLSLEDAHVQLATGCLKSLSTGLKYDICKVMEPYRPAPLNEEIEDLEQRLERETTPALRYAAVHVLEHARESIVNQEVVAYLQDFFKNKLLFWIELMSYLEELYRLMRSIRSLQEQSKKGADLRLNEITQWCNETLEMKKPFGVVLESCAMQTYLSALAFMPSASRIHQYYSKLFNIPRVHDRALGSRSGPLVLGGSGRVVAIAFNSEGDQIVSASMDGFIRRWDMTTGTVSMQIKGDMTWPSSKLLSISPDGAHVCTLGKSDSFLLIWDTTTGKETRKELKRLYVLINLVISDDGRMVAFACATVEGYGFVILDIEPETMTFRSQEQHPGRINALSFSPDGQLLYSGADDGTIYVWDTGSCQKRDELRTEGLHGVKCIAVSPTGQLVAAGFRPLRQPNAQRGSIHLWGRTSQSTSGSLFSYLRKIFHSTDSEHEIVDLIFSPCNQYLAAAFINGEVGVFNLSADKILRILRGPTEYGIRLAYSPSGEQLAAASWDGNIYVWNSPNKLTGTEDNDHKRDSLTCITFSKDGNNFATSHRSGSISLWDIATPKGFEKCSHDISVTSLSYSPNGHLLASCDDNQINIWNTLDGTLKARAIFQGHFNKIGPSKILFSPTGGFIVAIPSMGPKAKAWIIDAETGEVKHTWTGEFLDDFTIDTSGEFYFTLTFSHMVSVCDISDGNTVFIGWAGYGSTRSLTIIPSGEKPLLVVNEKEVWELDGTNVVHRSEIKSYAGTRLAPALCDVVRVEHPWVHVGASLSFCLPSGAAGSIFASQGGMFAYGRDRIEGIIDFRHLIPTE